ncbi:Androgen-induced gene 1 protein [Caenorhabditis elegans]|uniref:Androgen-induced gene 1 protein n=1 Tax=Caenorhabditis elegans TaxID=6239 RepID=H2KY55_CAEEL|nr:Androgen-induced gene 1 protein [Caenorhabditis elegans]CCD61147.1 Androgen-induced gene 1 protein [Caenorhabditis elegans]|eukprot:NP_510864.1 Uncharacterized protein CELE_cTel55X.1 [Caenorhabditis elegans]
MIKVIFHLVSAVLYAAVCYRDTTIVTGALLPIPYQTWSRFVWLTIIDLYMQLLYHTIGFILAVVSPNKRHIIFDYWARALTGPIGVAVTVLFWGLFLFDPATLARDEMAMKILTLFWFNHGLHTLPAITAHLDLAIYNHTSFSTSAILKGIAVFVTLYLIDFQPPLRLLHFWLLGVPDSRRTCRTIPPCVHCCLHVHCLPRLRVAIFPRCPRARSRETKEQKKKLKYLFCCGF